LNTPRIALLILAHKNQGQLNKLVDHLKSDFSVYVHIDSNSKIQVDNQKNVYTIKKFKSYWGSFNAVLAIRELLKNASTGNHERYLLISGQDVPVKRNQEIIQFFTGNRNNYIRGGSLDELKQHQWRMRYFHLNSYNCGKLLNKLQVITQYKLGMLQDILGLYRTIPAKLYVGSTWFNLTREAVMICLDKMYDRKYINQFKCTKCADEIVIQSIMYNSSLMSSIIQDDLRYADWSAVGAHPKVLTVDDYDKVINSGKLFARKFDEKVDRTLIDEIYRSIA
jgi:hypothetical protein